MVFGIIGCILTIYVIVTSPKLKKKPFHNMIISLCCSDMLSALVSWILLHRRTWGFEDFLPVPNIFCNIFFSIDLMTSFTTAMHILYFALQRYRLLKGPIGTPMNIKLTTVWRCLIGIWILAFVSGFIPMWLFTEAKHRERGTNSMDARWPSCTLKSGLLVEHRIYQWIAYSLFLIIPAIGIIFLSFKLVKIVNQRKPMPGTNLRTQEIEKRRRKKDKEARLQLYSIVVMFILGYAPITTYDFWALRNEDTSDHHRKIDYWFGTLAYIFLRLSEVANIIIYNYFYPDIWKETKNTLRKIFKCFIIGKKSEEDKNKSHLPTSIGMSSQNQSTTNEFELKRMSNQNVT